ncbi:MAG: EF-hand domain-containing protein [Rhodobacteraceae bacterium]|nr:EF-hand domain-containing protein [Paracoccaceae bacterium]
MVQQHLAEFNLSNLASDGGSPGRGFRVRDGGGLRPVRRLLPACLALIAAVSASSVSATSPETPARDAGVVDAGLALAEAVATEVDANGNGSAELREVLDYSREAFVAVDADNSGDVSFTEFETDILGFRDLAEFRERLQAYQTANRIAFDLFDRDNSGAVSLEEHELAVANSVFYADLDGDSKLSREEFLNGFIYFVVLRNGLVE